MLSDLVDDDLLTTPIKPMVNTSSNNSVGGSVVLMQPKLEPQPVVFDQQQQQQQSKMLPIVARYDSLQQCSGNSGVYTCSNCTQPIHERYLLYTQDRLCRGNYWHMQCLRCQCCDAVLADISSTFYTKDNALLCKSDYIKRYGSRPCSSCGQVIGSNEQVMRVSPNYVYHLQCFTCIKCHARLVKGDRYVFFNGQLFCEKDNPLKSTTNITHSPATKRGANTSKRGGKAAMAAASRAAAAAAAAAQAQQQTFVPPSTPMHHQYHPGHLTLMNNHHMHSSSSTITHSLLNNTTTTNSNGSSSSLATPSGDELY